MIDAKLSEAELENIFQGISREHRFYPTDTGWKVKFPYWYVSKLLSMGDCGFSERDFKREAKGWDHEHCSFCNAHIQIREKCYTVEHEEGGVYVICLKCADQCK